MIVFLSAKQIVELHDYSLSLAGGEEGGGHRGYFNEGADAVAQAVKNAYYETVYELGAAYAVYTVQGHAFLDACKRTGSFSMMAFLSLNGVSLSAKSTLEIQAAMVLMQRLCEPEDGSRPWPTDRLVEWLAAKIENEWAVVRRRGHASGRARRGRAPRAGA